jgi:hypothetical protein
MPVDEAHIETANPSRLLDELCRHLDANARSHPERRVEIEWSPDRGTADFGWGRCTLQAEPGTLVMRAEAADTEALEHRKELLAREGTRRRVRPTRPGRWRPPPGGRHREVIRYLPSWPRSAPPGKSGRLWMLT